MNAARGTIDAGTDDIDLLLGYDRVTDPKAERRETGGGREEREEREEEEGVLVHAL